jgi:hypothetical protein
MTEPAGGWDVFVAYPSHERVAADEFYQYLVDGGASVFLDHVVLKLGDPWAARLAEAQNAARITVVLVSRASGPAFYQRDEIARGIGLARKGTHRVVPVYLDDEADPPYGLLALHAARVSEAGGLAPIAAQVLALLGMAPSVAAPAADRALPGTARPVPLPPRRSPFRPGMPLYATDRYTADSRRRLLHTVRADITGGTNVNLVGERRMGRTSLLNHVYAGLLVDPGVVVVRVNLQDGVDGAEGFWGALLWGLVQAPAGARAVTDSRRRGLDDAQASTYHEVRRVLRDVRSETTTVVLVDEFERCFDSLEAFPLPAFFDNVRSMLGGDAYGPYAHAVVATRRPLAEYFVARQVTSVLPTYLPPRELELLSAADAEEILTQPSPHPLSPSQRDQAQAWSGGHPCRLQCAAEAWYRGAEGGRDDGFVKEQFGRLSRQLCIGAPVPSP